MTIQRGDFVRPNNPSGGLPQGSVWRVVCSAGELKLEPENGIDLRNPHTRKAEYRARPIEERLHGSPAKAYKPAHGGYPG